MDMSLSTIAITLCAVILTAAGSYWRVRRQRGSVKNNSPTRCSSYPNLSSIISENTLVDEEERVLLRLNTYFLQEKPYTGNIRLDDVAKNLCVSKYSLSKIINKRTSKNFNQFVNDFRVREACNQFLNNKRLTIEEAGRLSGFNNYSSFCSAFRFTVGFTPKLWAKQIEEKLRRGEEVDLEEYFNKIIK